MEAEPDRVALLLGTALFEDACNLNAPRRLP
jgi:hypothetical protein